MENEVIKEYQLSYFKDISRAIGIHQLANLIQYNAGAADENADLLEREEAAKMRMVNSIKMRECDTEKIVGGLEEYGDTIQSVYFEIGVQIGICLQAELLKNKSKFMVKRKEMKETTEFKEYLFDVISEADEPMFQDVKVDEDTGEIVVKVMNGNEYIVKCKRK